MYEDRVPGAIRLPAQRGYQRRPDHPDRLVVEGTKPLHHYRDPKGTVAQILKYNPNAKDSIEALLV